MGRDARPQFFVALLHYPVYNKSREVVATSLTTLNLHDLARLVTTYGVTGCYVVTPLQRQRELAGRMVTHWTEGYGAAYNPTRGEALQNICLVGGLAEVVLDITSRCGHTPCTIATDARQVRGCTSYSDLREVIWRHSRAFLLLLGTGWGLTDDLMGECYYILDPIAVGERYNHLPVRVAAGIMLDRLLG
jgi:hypothetical protein